jgi:hypothetical protein
MLPTALAACSASSSSPGGSGPPPARAGAAAAFDEKREQLVLFGGRAVGGSADLSDTWTWDRPHGWLSHPGAGGPPARSGAAMAYNPETGSVVLAGGSAGSRHFADTWLWNGSRWSRGGALNGLSEATTHSVALAFDPSHLQLTLSACCGADGHPLTFVGDGSFWNAENPDTAKQPTQDAQDGFAAMGFAPIAGGRAILATRGRAAGSIATTSEWNGIEWGPGRNVTDITGTAPPDPRLQLAESPDDGTILALVNAAAGTTPSTLLRWQGDSWRAPAASTHPPYILAMATDVRDGQVLMVGGGSPSGDTDSVLGWYGGAAHAPRLGGRAHADPTFGPTVAPPAPKALPASAYVLSPAEVGPGYHYPSNRRPGPLSGSDAANATSTWEAVYEGGGYKLVVIDVYEYPTADQAQSNASDFGQAPSDEGGVQLSTDVQLGDSSVWVYKATVLTNAEFYAVVWTEGGVVFVISTRDAKGAATLDTALALAEKVDAKAH